MKLSIIIPAYNVGHYIERCLDSIFCQAAPEDSFEAIVINDGSTDGTPLILESYKERYSNITYITRENRGLSATRNEGLKLAKGDYVWFIDSDDAVSPNSISKIISFFERYPNADLLIFDDIHWFESSGKTEYVRSWTNGRFNFFRRNIYEKKLGRKNGDRLKSAICQLFVYKRRFLLENNLFFLEGIWHEDDEIRMRVFFFAKELRYIPYAPYIYTMMRAGSITGATIKTYNPKSLEANLKTLKNWQSFINNNCKSSADRRFVNDYKIGVYFKMLELKHAPDDSDARQKYLENRIKWQKDLVRSFLHSNWFYPKNTLRFFYYLIRLGL